MGFARSKATVGVAVVVLLATAGGVFGATRLLTVARNHYKAANTAADLKFDVSDLSSLSDDYTLTPGSSSLRAAVTVAEERVAADLTSLITYDDDCPTLREPGGEGGVLFQDIGIGCLKT